MFTSRSSQPASGLRRFFLGHWIYWILLGSQVKLRLIWRSLKALWGHSRQPTLVEFSPNQNTSPPASPRRSVLNSLTDRDLVTQLAAIVAQRRTANLWRRLFVWTGQPFCLIWHMGSLRGQLLNMVNPLGGSHNSALFVQCLLTHPQSGHISWSRSGLVIMWNLWSISTMGAQCHVQGLMLQKRSTELQNFCALPSMCSTTKPMDLFIPQIIRVCDLTETPPSTHSYPYSFSSRIKQHAHRSSNYFRSVGFTLGCLVILSHWFSSRSLGRIFGDGNTSKGISRFRVEHDCSTNTYCLHFHLDFSEIDVDDEVGEGPNTD